MSKSASSEMRRSIRHAGGVYLIAGALCIGIADAATTGWQQTSGSFTYDDTANWVGGNINNLFDTSLTLAGPLQLSIPQSYTTTGNLVFNYAQGQAANNITLNGAAPSVLTLGGNLTFNPTLAATGSLPTLTLGGNVTVDLAGATRTINTRFGALVTAGSFQNGTLIVSGFGDLTLNGTLSLAELYVQNGGVTSHGVISGPGIALARALSLRNRGGL